MNLIAILICLALQKIVNVGNDFALPFFEKYLGWIKRWLKSLNPWLALTAIVAPFIIILAILHLATLNRLLGLPYLVIASVVLFFSMDGRDLEKMLVNYFNAVRENNTAKTIKSGEEFTGQSLAKDGSDVYRSVSNAVFIKSFNELFAPLFWFMVFCFYGAAIYCLVATVERLATKVDGDYSEIAKAAGKVKEILDWIPVRITTLTYALAGHFSIAFSNWYKKLLIAPAKQQEFNVESGISALDAASDSKQADVKENNFALQLVNRALIIWLAAIVLFTLGGWLT